MKITNKYVSISIISFNIIFIILNYLFALDSIIFNNIFMLSSKLIIPFIILVNIILNTYFIFCIFKKKCIQSNLFSMLILSNLLAALIHNMSQFAPLLFFISFIEFFIHYYIYKSKIHVCIFIVIFYILLSASCSTNYQKVNINTEKAKAEEVLSTEKELENFIEKNMYSYDNIKIKKIDSDNYTIYATYNSSNLELYNFISKTTDTVINLKNSDDIIALYIKNIIFKGLENNDTKYYIDYKNFYSINKNNLNSNVIILDSNKQPLNTSFEAEKEKYIASYKKSCKAYEYKEIFRYAEKYTGSKAKFKGEVVQVINDSTYRVNTKRTSYGYYDDTIYVEFYDQDNITPRILENDKIVIYGTLNGLHTYETVLGNEVTIPKMQALYIDIAQ